MDIVFRQFVRLGFLFGLLVVICILPFSKYVLSIGQFILTGAWILERLDLDKLQVFWNSRSRVQLIFLLIPYLLYLMFLGIFRGFQEFFRNKPALIFSSIILLHVVGLMFTFDFDYALKDLRTKLPLLLLPLFLSTSGAIGKKGFYAYMLAFFIAVLVGTILHTWKIVHHEYIDIRDVAKHVSHIIFGLLITLSLFSLGYFILKKKLFPLWVKGLLMLVFLWFVSYLIISKSITGLAIALLVLMILIPILIFRTKNRWLKVGLVLVILGVSGGVAQYLRHVINDYYTVLPVDYSKLEAFTSRGNPYNHNFHVKQTENGHFLWLFVNYEEMRSAWNMRSKLPFDSLDLKGQPLKFTLVRFLTSKGWRKDADAVEMLTQPEIEAVEKGVANYIFMKEFSIRGRIYEFLWGFENYRLTGNPTGSTLMQRLEFWKASAALIRANWLYGVGTGDMNQAFKNQYTIMQSKLAPEQRWRSHNQFMSVFIGFGIFGLAWFLFAIFYPPWKLKRYDDYFFLVFLIISMLSMLTEDTIESQTGVTFFALFYSFFLFARKGKEGF